MRVTEAHLAEMLAGTEPARDLARDDPVAALLVESLATTEPEHAEHVREAGRSLCALVRSTEGARVQLNPSLAMHTLVREQLTSPDRMWSHLAATAERDVLLGLSAQALLRGGQARTRRSPAEHQAVLRTLFLLVRAFEAQEETDALEQAWQAEQPTA